MTELRKQINNIVEDHQACLVLANSIKTSEVYKGTTATAEDIREGKTAYSNGELITGILESEESPYNTQISISVEAGSYQTSYRGIFNNLHKYITKIDTPITTSSTSVMYLFGGCESLQEVSEVETTNKTNFQGMFSGCKNLLKSPEIYTNYATTVGEMFQNCSSLEIAPTISTNDYASASYVFANCTSLVDASGVAGLKANNIYGIFMNCTNLENVPQFSVTSSIHLQNSFSGCPALTDESLNNIMAMFTSVTPNATNAEKTLKYIGLSEEQATKCQSLSNYEAFAAAGWSMGY